MWITGTNRYGPVFAPDTGGAGGTGGDSGGDGGSPGGDAGGGAGDAGGGSAADRLAGDSGGDAGGGAGDAGGKTEPFDGEAAFSLWMEGAPEALKSNPAIARHKSIEGMASALANAQALIGGEKLPKPKGPDDTEALDAIYSALGRPEDPSGYEFQGYEPKGGFSDMDKSFHQAMAPKLHEAGISPAQLDVLVPAFSEFFEAQQGSVGEAQKQADARAESELRSEWGAAYDQKMQAAKASAVALGMTTEDIDAMEQGAGFVSTMKVFANIQDKIGEGGLPTGDGQATFGAMTPSAAKARLVEVNASLSEFAGKMNIGRDPKYKALRQEAADLQKMIHPEDK